MQQPALVVADIREQVAKREMEDRSDTILLVVGGAQIGIEIGAASDGNPPGDGWLRRSGRRCCVKTGLQKVSTAHGLVRVAGIPGKRKRLRASSLVVCPSELARHGRKLFGTFSAKCAKSL